MDESGSKGAGGESTQPVVRELTVTDPTGFHCLPAGQIAKIAMEFHGTIEVERDGRRADAKSVMQLLALLAVPDKNVKFKVIVNGHGAETAIANMEKALRGELVAVDSSAKKEVVQPKTRSGWAHHLTSFLTKGPRR